MDILDLLTGKLLDKNIVGKLSKSTGADTDKMQEAVKLGIPTLVQAMGKNAKSSQGASSLAEALNDHKDDKVDDIGDFLKNVDTKEGSKILDHIFGSNNKNVHNNISKQTGLKENQVSEMMMQLAPLIMGILAKQKSSRNVGSSGLSSMLMNLLGSGDSKDIMNTMTNLIDSNNDGHIMDDIGKIAGGFFNKK